VYSASDRCVKCREKLIAGERRKGFFAANSSQAKGVGLTSRAAGDMINSPTCCKSSVFTMFAVVRSPDALEQLLASHFRTDPLSFGYLC
jgi:hypothetical protein